MVGISHSGSLVKESSESAILRKRNAEANGNMRGKYRKLPRSDVLHAATYW